METDFFFLVISTLSFSFFLFSFCVYREIYRSCVWFGFGDREEGEERKERREGNEQKHAIEVAKPYGGVYLGFRLEREKVRNFIKTTVLYVNIYIYICIYRYISIHVDFLPLQLHPILDQVCALCLLILYI